MPGGLIAAILASPATGEGRRPLFVTEDIKPFYFERGPLIFPHKWCSFATKIAAFWDRRYDGEYLWAVIRGRLGKTRVCDTLTNVIIPTFDVKLLQLIFFSTRDVCILPMTATFSSY